MHKRTSWGLLAILGLTIIIGFYLRNESGYGTRVDHPIRADARDYYMYAYNLRHKQTYSREVISLENVDNPVTPDALRSPGYPLFLSIFVDDLPNNRTIAKIIIAQMILSTIVLVVAFGIYNCFLSGYWAAAALLLTALSPHLIAANSYLLTETLFCLVLVLSGCLLSLFFFRPSFYLAAVSGLLLGVATLIRPGLQYFPIVLAAILVVKHGRRKGFYFVAALMIGYLVILSPWFIRKLKIIDSTSNDTLKINFLHHGMYPEFKFDGLDKSYGFPYQYDPRSGEISKSTTSVFKEIARRFRDEPAQHLKWYLIKKPFVFWSWNNIQGLGDVFLYPVHQTPYRTNLFFKWTHFLMRYLHWPLVLLCAVGCMMVWSPQVKNQYPEKSLYVARFVSALLLYFTVIHIIGAPFPRYSIPLRPFLYGMAIFCLHMFYTSVKTKRVNI